MSTYVPLTFLLKLNFMVLFTTAKQWNFWPMEFFGPYSIKPGSQYLHNEGMINARIKISSILASQVSDTLPQRSCCAIPYKRKFRQKLISANLRVPRQNTKFYPREFFWPYRTAKCLYLSDYQLKVLLIILSYNVVVN